VPAVAADAIVNQWPGAGGHLQHVSEASAGSAAAIVSG
jgi:hypothetical protein